VDLYRPDRARPGRSCHTAIAEAKTYLADEYEWVVDLDLEKFFGAPG
jgi:retron-type reverse transcriptase